MKIYSTEMWSIAHQLLSHKEREVRDLAIMSIAMMKEIFPKELIAKLEAE